MTVSATAVTSVSNKPGLLLKEYGLPQDNLPLVASAEVYKDSRLGEVTVILSRANRSVIFLELKNSFVAAAKQTNQRTPHEISVGIDNVKISGTKAAVYTTLEHAQDATKAVRPLFSPGFYSALSKELACI